MTSEQRQPSMRTMADRRAAAKRLDVSRETECRLDAFVAILRKWSPALNLVGRNDLDVVWSRHILDSAQLLTLAPESAREWLDLGSGGGFPGLVVAAIAAEQRPALRVSLVESDARKCAFLEAASRSMSVRITVHRRRIEEDPPLPSDVVSARALAPMVQLLPWAARHMKPDGVALFLKGAGVDAEMASAGETWRYRVCYTKSVTDPSGVVLSIREITRANDG